MGNLIFLGVVVIPWRLEPPTVNHDYQASNDTRVHTQQFLPEMPFFHRLRQVCLFCEVSNDPHTPDTNAPAATAFLSLP